MSEQAITQMNQLVKQFNSIKSKSTRTKENERKGGACIR